MIVDARGADNRKTKTGKLLPISPIMMRSLMGEAAKFERFDRRANAFAPTKPPADVAELILDRSGHWPFPAIRGILMAPSMRPDGSLITKPGYDPETELFLLDPPVMPVIPDRPTREDAERALQLLAGLLEEFPFSDDDSEAVAYSGLITPVIRAALDRIPMHAYSAPEIGTGKSYFVDLCATLATGFPCPVITMGKDEREFEKQLHTVLIAGHPLISIDNISKPLQGDFLCLMIERPAVKVRVLGLSKDAHVEPLVVPYATGNNIVLVGDIVRRTVLCRFDRQEENPYLHQFNRDPLQAIAKDRGTYIAAALTIVRAFLASGEAPIKPPLASFRAWSDLVRSPLAWLGCGDPVGTITASRQDDPARQSFVAVYDAWRATFGTDAVECSDVVEKAEEKSPFSYKRVRPGLYDALSDVAEARRHPQCRAARQLASRPAGQGHRRSQL